MIRVLVVEDQRMVRQLFEETIERSGRYSLVASIENARNAIAFCMTGQVDLILMDVFTAQGENGIEAAKTIKERYPQVKIIIITSLPEESFVRKARQASCDSFWYKEDGQELLQLMDRTMAGERLYPDRTPVLDIGLASSVEFTARELDVLRELVNGRSYKEVADQLGIGERTVKQHISNMLMKTSYKNTLQLVVDVVNQKLIIPGF